MAQTTTDHDIIRRWVEERGGCPAHVKRTGADGDPGILRIDFPGFSGQKSLEKLGWDEFFEAFDANELAFVYQDRTRGGQPSRFNKLISRASAGDGAGRAGRKSGGSARGARRQGERDDAIALLEEQHREVEQLAVELSELERGEAAFRRKFLALADALAIHTTIEEQIFYPAVKRADTAELLQHSVEEHLEAKRVLATLLDGASDSNMKEELEELVGLTEEHVIEEEHELFPAVRETLDANELADLGRRMNELVARLKSEGEPRQHVRDELEQPAQV